MEIGTILAQYIPLVLSTIVSVVAILVNFYQARITNKTKINEMYFSAQLEAYQNLFDALADLEKNPNDQPEDYSAVIRAGQKAMLLSTHRNASIIDNFCAVYLDFVEAENANKLTDELVKEFRESKLMLTVTLRDELFRFDTQKRKSNKQRNRFVK